MTVDASSVLALTQVTNLNQPVLTIVGNAKLEGVLALTLSGSPLRSPLIRVSGDLEISGSFVIDLSDAYPASVR